MGESFDPDGTFNDDYLHFAQDALDDDADTQVELLLGLVPLVPGTEILDLACGHGRIANRLVAQGLLVTGLDITPLFLDIARAEAGARHVAVDYVLGDMRELPWRGRFDAVVCWFTAFGYFDDDTNRSVLAQVHAALRPGGRFVLELNHRDELMRRHAPVSFTRRGDDIRVDEHVFDPLSGRNEVTRTVVRDGAVRTTTYFVRLFSFTELCSWLLQAGFETVDGYGPDGRPLTAASTRMIVVASR